MAEYNPSKIIKDGNTYNFRDTTKIPLAGSNAISGSLIPSTDNSIDVGSSTKNLKMLYTKGITINGTQFLPSDYATLSGLSTVATSGSYTDLSDKPTIPTVNNATLTIQKNGTTVGTFSANQATDETINIVVPDALPIGSYIQFAGSQAPAGFLVCNGGEISRTTYSALFAVIGTTYGSGDGSTTFNLPNLTDRFLQGSTTSGTVKDAGLPNITGKLTTDVGNQVRAWGGCTGAFFDQNKANCNDPTVHSGNHNKPLGFSFDASRSNSIYGESSTVQPPALTCLICIKY